MNIKIVDSWLREFLKTKATPKKIAQELSLRSVSVERLEEVDSDFVYDIEITTNRVDLMSVEAIAKETAASLNQAGILAKFIPNETPQEKFPNSEFPIKVETNENLTRRIMAVVLEANIGNSPKDISKRLQLTGIRSLNNVIDVTNYIMRQVGHPSHVFDFDLLTTKKIIVRQSKKGEKIETLDGKIYELAGEDIVADDGSGKIIDLLGIMGTANSVVKDTTKRILFFLDNNNPQLLRKTSMNLGIRTEAAIINEKGIDPNLAEIAFYQGLELFKKIAEGKVISSVLDIYPKKPKTTTIKTSLKRISDVIGVEIEYKKCVEILQSLDFDAKIEGENLVTIVPSIRADVKEDEDIIEEIARIYGYQNIPSVIPTFVSSKRIPYANSFYFEQRVKTALKYYGFSEVYTNSLVSEELYQGPIGEAIKLSNPLSSDLVYLRNSLIPSLLMAVKDNPSHEVLNIFELSKVYIKRVNNLPYEMLTLGAVIKKPHANFYETKGLVEQILKDLGIENISFKKSGNNVTGAAIYFQGQHLGEIEVLDSNLIDFELDFEKILGFANINKTFKPFAKFPPIFEDISIISDASTEEIIKTIIGQDKLIVNVTLKDTYQNSRTFHIVYQDFEKNLTTKDIAQIKTKIIEALKNNVDATVKE